MGVPNSQRSTQLDGGESRTKMTPQGHQALQVMATRMQHPAVVPPERREVQVCTCYIAPSSRCVVFFVVGMLAEEGEQRSSGAMGPLWG